VVSGSGPSDGAIQAAIELSLDNARMVGRDKFIGPAEPRFLFEPGDGGQLGIFDDAISRLSFEDLEKTALHAESLLLATDHTARSVETNVTSQTRNLAFHSSLGLSASYQNTGITLTLSAIKPAGLSATAGDPAGVTAKSGTGEVVSCTLSGLDAERAAADAASEFNEGQNRTCPSGNFTVVLAPEAARYVAYSLLVFVSPSVQSRVAPDSSTIGKQVSSQLVTLVDDSLIPGGLGTAPFDHEGVSGRRKTLVENGVLRENLLNSYRARLLDRVPTGNAIAIPDVRYAVTPSNAFLSPGAADPADMISGVSQGLYVKRFLSRLDQVSSDSFDQQATGIWIEGGRLTYPVRTVALSGRLPDLFYDVRAVANDLKTSVFAVSSPTLQIGKMNIRPLL
ncbi:MAG: TldD/PmbA family protein, partial [Blastocatellia bacterium]